MSSPFSHKTHQIITLNGQVRPRPSAVSGSSRFCSASPDKLTAEADFTTPIKVSGGGGNDTIITGGRR